MLIIGNSSTATIEIFCNKPEKKGIAVIAITQECSKSNTLAHLNAMYMVT